WRDRPLTLQRFPDGLDADGFFQQQRADHFPGWLPGQRLDRADGSGRVAHVLCNEPADLRYLADQGTVTFHGWLSRRGAIDRPDRLLFDLDPPGSSFEPVRFAARELRALLRELGLTPFLMTTGSRGAHVVVPIEPRSGFDAVRRFANAVADLLARRHPERLTTAQRKNAREGRLFLDVQRNSRGQTGVLPYSLRARPGAPVATPLDWRELDRDTLDAQSYRLDNLRQRLGAKRDPWAGIDRHAARLDSVRPRLTELGREA
ncbi:MAG: ATP-dependent DNA ligase, partial [Gammaproteobacteria bacterium]|nr:ATP-dependent DNA ligase [Gammaproteobacteria bacterium]